jgi:hypothetical protein
MAAEHASESAPREAAWQAPALEVIVAVQRLLMDADPLHLGMNARREQPFATLKPLHDQWTAALRPALATYALAHPSANVRDLGQRLAIAVTTALVSAAWYLSDLTDQWVLRGADFRANAIEAHEKARSLAEEFGATAGSTVQTA